MLMSKCPRRTHKWHSFGNGLLIQSNIYVWMSVWMKWLKRGAMNVIQSAANAEQEKGIKTINDIFGVLSMSKRVIFMKRDRVTCYFLVQFYKFVGILWTLLGIKLGYIHRQKHRILLMLSIWKQFISFKKNCLICMRRWAV